MEATVRVIVHLLIGVLRGSPRSWATLLRCSHSRGGYAAQLASPSPLPSWKRLFMSSMRRNALLPQVAASRASVVAVPSLLQPLQRRATCRAAVSTRIPSPRVTAVVCSYSCVLPAPLSLCVAQMAAARCAAFRTAVRQAGVVPFCAAHAAVYAPVGPATRASMRGACLATAILVSSPCPVPVPVGLTMIPCRVSSPPSGERCSAWRCDARRALARELPLPDCQQLSTVIAWTRFRDRDELCAPCVSLPTSQVRS